MKRKRKLLIIFITVVCFLLLGSVIFDFFKKRNPNETVFNSKLSEQKEEQDVDQLIESDSIIDQTDVIPTEEPLPEEEMVVLPEPPNETPMTSESVIPNDIYVFMGNEGKIKCYVEAATEYTWEYYDDIKKEWKIHTENKNILLTGETDELNRSVSTLIIKGTEENEGLLVRCKVMLPDEEEETIYQASFNILQFEAEDIKDIIVSDQEMEAGAYISTLDIPVTIIKKDDSEEQITGLYDLFFCMPKGISSDTAKNDDGTTIETVTTTTLESEYSLVEAGENEILLRYRGVTPSIDINASVTGSDGLAPDVTAELSDYNVSNSDAKAVPVTITINATDNYTSLTKLLYALKPKGVKVQNEDFTKNNKVELNVEKNGVWTAYAKDAVGNIGEQDIEIVTVDQKKPTIESVALKEKGDEWYTENVICVVAKDKTAMQYTYLCETANIDSGWVAESEYVISTNGTWTIRVKDAADNENEENLTVTNVDSQSPVILGIQAKEEEKDNIYTGTLEERVNVTVYGPEGKEVEVNGLNNEGIGSVTGTNAGITRSNYGSSGSGYSTGNNIGSIKGENGAIGATGATGATGKDGLNAFIHIRYAENITGENMLDAPVDSSRYIGVYSGTSSVAPMSASSYKWSQYKGSSSQLYIRYADKEDGVDMTEKPTDTSSYMGVCNTTEAKAPETAESYTWSKYKESSSKVYIMYAQNNMGEGMSAIPEETSSYIGICSTTDTTAPETAESYTWSKYKDNEAIIELQNQISDLKSQIEEIKNNEGKRGEI